MKKVFTTIILSFLLVGLIPALFFVACSDKDTESLSFGSDIYGVTLGNNVEVEIVSGNGKYAVVSEDESVVLAGYSKTGKKSAGKLVLTGRRIGETWVMVTDEISNDQIRLKVVVTEPYFSIFAGLTKVIVETDGGEIEYYDELKEMLEAEYPFGDDDFFFHIMRGSDAVRIEQRPGTQPKAIYEGTYDIAFRSSGDCILLVSFDKGEETVTKEYTVSQGSGYALFTAFFRDQTGEPTRNSYAYYDLTLTEDLTDKYRELYPDLTFAGIECTGEVSVNSWMNVKLYQ